MNRGGLRLRKSERFLAVVVPASSLLFLSMFTGRKRSLDRCEGVVFLLLYAGYIAFVVLRG